MELLIVLMEEVNMFRRTGEGFRSSLHHPESGFQIDQLAREDLPRSAI